MHLSPTVAWTVVPVVGFLMVKLLPQYGLPFDCVPMKAYGRAICMSELVLTFQPHAPRPPSQWVMSPSQALPVPSQVAELDAVIVCPDEGLVAGDDDAGAGAAEELVTTGAGA